MLLIPRSNQTISGYSRHNYYGDSLCSTIWKALNFGQETLAPKLSHELQGGDHFSHILNSPVHYYYYSYFNTDIPIHREVFY